MQCMSCRREKNTALLNGEAVCSWCPQWADECKQRDASARIVLRIDTRTRRELWLTNYEREHGVAATERLRNTVRAMWPARAELLGPLASKKE